MPARGGVWAVLWVLVLCGCDEPLVDGRFTQDEWDLLASWRRVDAEPSACSEDPSVDCAAAAVLGRDLFFDTSYAGCALPPIEQVGEMSCATCHRPPWFVDTTGVSAKAHAGDWTKHNALGMTDLAFVRDHFTWDGGYTDLAEVLDLPVKPKDGMYSPMATDDWCLAYAIADGHDTAYRDAFGEIPTTPAGLLDATRLYASAKIAFAAYERKLTTGDAPFDAYVDSRRPDPGAIGEAAKRGASLFIRDAMCAECHPGPRFTDGKFHNTRVRQRGDHVPATDWGQARRACLDGDDACLALAGKFRTPSLRNVAMTAPYFHTGERRTLGEVLDFYWHGGDPDEFVGTADRMLFELDFLTRQDRDDLVAFLETLTGVEVDASWYTP